MRNTASCESISLPSWCLRCTPEFPTMAQVRKAKYGSVRGSLKMSFCTPFHQKPENEGHYSRTVTEGQVSHTPALQGDGASCHFRRTCGKLYLMVSVPLKYST
eukprot:scaffold719_cov359-Prasinococcus_capsulatus_cf.AAC.14